MSLLTYIAGTAVLLSGPVEHVVALDSGPPDRKLAATKLADVDADFDYQGEYLGQVRAVDGTPVVFGLQVVALGDGQFSAMGYQDGLPGNGWDREMTISWNGTRQGSLLTFNGPRGRIVMQGGAGLVIDSSGTAVGQVAKVRRVSATLGAAPPSEATVLFDGTSANAFENGELTEEGWLDVGALTRAMVEDFRLHHEFRLPYMPYARNQGRANSGVYIQRRYEVQILDSFGLEPVFNGCAALYRQHGPGLNMSFPPLDWQTYDIFFTAARWDDAGNKIADARISVYHNGVAVHKDRVVPTKTGAGKPETPQPGPILLQDHGNPVRFRNVWLLAGQSATAQEIEAVAQVAEPVDEMVQVIEPREPCASDYDAPVPYSLGAVGGGCTTCPGHGGWILWRGRYPN